ncbi:MAG: HIT domain-containing protein [Phycisphaerales bacterium]|nr:MAG: HIT domain-containing protein [Phycisphaerales bacterium]
MSEFNTNLWAPWRMDYIRSLSAEAAESGCFLCRYASTPEDDAANHVVWRGADCLVVMNRFPYTNGHLMVAPTCHVGELADVPDDVYARMSDAVRKSVTLLKLTVSAQGFNIGYNLGLCAGAGLPDHVHAHVVPRWNGDTNYMAVLGKVRVVPDALDALYVELRTNAAVAGLGE